MSSYEIRPQPRVVPLDQEKTPTRAQVLHEVAELLTGDRAKDYGEPKDNYDRLVGILNQVIPELKWTYEKVSLVLLALKLARAANGYKKDSYVDLAGYAAIAIELIEEENGTQKG